MDEREAETLASRNRRATASQWLAICFALFGCAAADRRQFTLALQPFETRNCGEKDVRVLESRHFDANSTVFVISVCGRAFELEESLYEEVPRLDPEEMEAFRSSLDGSSPPAEVRRRAALRADGIHQPVYLGSDVGGDQGRRRYWFALDGIVFFVSHRLGRPNCDHYLHQPHVCPL